MSKLSKVSTNLFRDGNTKTYYMVVRRNGKQFKESLETTDRTLASVKLHDRLSKLPTNLGMVNRNATWAEVEKQFVEIELASRKPKPSTLTDRLGNLANIKRDWPDLPTTELRTIKELDCKAWLVRRLKQPKAGHQRVNNEIGALKQVFKFAIDDLGVIARNPAACLKRLKMVKREPRMPSRKNFEAVITDMREKRQDDAADIVELLAYSGLRLGELQKVTWEDIDFERGRFYVAGDRETATKNWEANSRPIFPRMRPVLESMHQRRGDNVSGKILAQKQCRDALTVACERCKVERLTHRTLRHLFVTECIEAGIDLKLIGRWCGHKTGSQMIERVYGHLRDEHEKSMLKKLGEHGKSNGAS